MAVNVMHKDTHANRPMNFQVWVSVALKKTIFKNATLCILLQKTVIEQKQHLKRWN